MLYPITNKFRTIIDLSGFWKFSIDHDKIGEKEKWFEGLCHSKEYQKSNIEIAVPGSWNEQLEEIGLLHYVGSAWYEKDFYLPVELSGKKILIRIGSADYNSKVWINNKLAGENNLGFLPFELDITDIIEPGKENRVVMLVNNELNDGSIPQGIKPEYYSKENRLREETYPATRFDFFPFGGIHRPVIISIIPENHFEQIKIETFVKSSNEGLAIVKVWTDGLADGEISLNITGGSNRLKKQIIIQNNFGETEVEISQCNFWSHENPFLYNFNFQLIKDGNIIDEYYLPAGIREVKVEGNKLLLNGKEIFLKGFGKHEDFNVIGKGLFLPLIVKDFGLMKWCNANSFRTSHYPYSEELMSYADRNGFLIIDEAPAVSLDFRHVNEQTLVNHKEFIQRLIDRDCNHPSVIMWAAGNEPNLVGEEIYFNGAGKEYWREVINFTKSLDPTRPVTVPNCQRAGIEDPVFEFCDIISINRYYGWYEHPGQLDKAIEALSKEMDEIYQRYKKPILITEFGADTMPGYHSTSDQMFTEEFQAKLIEMYIKLIDSKDYTIGEQVWNFSDFKTPQNFRRVVLNLKGVFSRDRAPKLAAFRLKDLWSAKKGIGEV
ncbi:MAG: beta-glucuronidase [Ignavibacteriaceae bacterium]